MSCRLDPRNLRPILANYRGGEYECFTTLHEWNDTTRFRVVRRRGEQQATAIADVSATALSGYQYRGDALRLLIETELTLVAAVDREFIDQGWDRHVLLGEN
jgi:hypothetical protein